VEIGPRKFPCDILWLRREGTRRGGLRVPRFRNDVWHYDTDILIMQSPLTKAISVHYTLFSPAFLNQTNPSSNFHALSTRSHRAHVTSKALSRSHKRHRNQIGSFDHLTEIHNLRKLRSQPPYLSCAICARRYGYGQGQHQRYSRQPLRRSSCHG
jgi:hypothetical protein